MSMNALITSMMAGVQVLLNDMKAVIVAMAAAISPAVMVTGASGLITIFGVEYHWYQLVMMYVMTTVFSLLTAFPAVRYLAKEFGFQAPIRIIGYVALAVAATAAILPVYILS